jgi:hypothetical protein
MVGNSSMCQIFLIKSHSRANHSYLYCFWYVEILKKKIRQSVPAQNCTTKSKQEPFQTFHSPVFSSASHYIIRWKSAELQITAVDDVNMHQIHTWDLTMHWSVYNWGFNVILHTTIIVFIAGSRWWWLQYFGKQDPIRSICDDIVYFYFCVSI